MKTILLSLLAVPLVAVAGCSSFRAMFDESPAEAEARRVRAEKRAQERRNGEAPRDPVADMLHIRRSEPAPLIVGSELSDVEREHVNSLLRSQDDRMVSPETEEIHRRLRQSSDAADTWVFGENPFKN